MPEQYNLPRSNQPLMVQPPPQGVVTPPNPVPMPNAAAVAPVRSRSDPRGLAAYIRETAAKYGVSPEIALRVAKSEGLAEFSGDGGKSGGAFQLYTGGGLGNTFQKETGLNPLDPNNEKATIDYALKHAAKNGWGPWYGAAKVGVGQYDGIPGRDSTAAPPLDPTPNVGSGASDYITPKDTVSTSTEKDDKKDDKKKDKYKDAAGDAIGDIGKLFSEGPVAKNAARASGPTNIAPPTQPMPTAPISMIDPKRAEMQRQQLAIAMQRLNSGKLV